MRYLAVSVLLIGAARADDVCKDRDVRFAEIEKRVSQIKEIVKQSPLPSMSYRTSTGAVFERVEREGFGKAWKAPDGTIWSEYQGNFRNVGPSNYYNGIVTNSAATRACAEIGGSLPTERNFRLLKTYFDLDSSGSIKGQEENDLYKVFPDMKGRWSWSSSKRSDEGVYAFGVSQLPTDVHFAPGYKHAVFCVAGR